MSQKHPPESILSALALLLGPETLYNQRVQASQRLAKHAHASLPLIISTLSQYPEITSPGWPFSPPQYEPLSKLLVHLADNHHLSLEALFEMAQPPGPVLWIGIIEASGLRQNDLHETLLQQGLTAPWETVRYAAAMTLARQVEHFPLAEPTIQQLRQLQYHPEILPVRLAAASALLRAGDETGLDTLLQLVAYPSPLEVRKAAILVISMESPQYLNDIQKSRLCDQLLRSLKDPLAEIAFSAAQLLGTLGSPEQLFSLSYLLHHSREQVRLATLQTLEAAAKRPAIRRYFLQQSLPMRIVPMVHSSQERVRRQACYTLAALGGEYATAVLGTQIISSGQPGQLEALEALRFLHGALHLPTRTQVIRWLLQSLAAEREDLQMAALNSLGYLVWQAQAHRKNIVNARISQEITGDYRLFQLLSSPHALLRQQAVTLLSMLDIAPSRLLPRFLRMLRLEPEVRLREHLLEQARRIGTVEAIPIFIQGLKDENRQISLSALEALLDFQVQRPEILRAILQELQMLTIGPHKEMLGKKASKILSSWPHDLE